MRLRPSETTKKLALPKLRMLMIRPADVVSTRAASSCSFDLPPCASTMTLTVSVVSNLFGYGRMHRSVMALSYARRWSI